MTPKDAAKLLTIASAFDNRKIAAEAAVAWAAALDGLRPVDVAAAIREHYAESTDFLMPAHLRRLVRRVRSKRIEAAAALMPAFPADPAEFIAARREWERLAGDGEFDGAQPAIEAPNPPRRAELTRMLLGLTASTAVPDASVPSSSTIRERPSVPRGRTFMGGDGQSHQGDTEGAAQGL